MKRTFTYILIGIIVLTISGIIFLFVMSSARTDAPTDAPAVSKQDKGDEKNYISYSPGESFITNIKNSSKFLKVKVVMEIKSEKSKPYFEKNNFKIKDTIIGVLRSKTESELIIQNSQELLKESIKTALANQIDIGDLVNIYFEEFVIQ